MLLHRRSRALQQEVIELNTPNGVLRCFLREVDPLDVEVQLLKADKAVRVRLRVPFEIVNNLWRDPAGTQFWSWEDTEIEDQQVNAGLAQFPGAGRACRTTANNDNVNLLHCLFGLGGIWRIQIFPVPRHIIVASRRKDNLKQL